MIYLITIFLIMIFQEFSSFCPASRHTRRWTCAQSHLAFHHRRFKIWFALIFQKKKKLLKISPNCIKIRCWQRTLWQCRSMPLSITGLACNHDNNHDDDGDGNGDRYNHPIRVSNATISVANVENCHHSTRLLAQVIIIISIVLNIIVINFIIILQTSLRNILGTKNLHEILSDRESIALAMQVGIPTWYITILQSWWWWWWWWFWWWWWGLRFLTIIIIIIWVIDLDGAPFP